MARRIAGRGAAAAVAGLCHSVCRRIDRAHRAFCRPRRDGPAGLQQLLRNGIKRRPVAPYRPRCAHEPSIAHAAAGAAVALARERQVECLMKANPPPAVPT